MKNRSQWQRIAVSLIGLVAAFTFLLPAARAEDTVCAKVNIKIVQEVTLERQAFDAHMRINNGLTTASLEDITVTVSFADENGVPVLASSDPNATDAKFFIRLDEMSNVNDVDGAGIVAPSTSADIHWLIIPAPGASNGLASGTLYYVGAKLTYTIVGEQNTTEVTPDYIFVKPMPMLTLDYFLTREVYGDDAFTPEIEPSIPFTLGVRVSNNGYGAAHKLKIDSAQPAIVDNEQGLLVNFEIIGSEVNGETSPTDLLVDFGDIEADSAAVARWLMTASLSGTFTDFTAVYSHADELGGELTSLMEAVNTHSLVRDVLVDLPGRDDLGDFLAKDNDIYWVYESEGIDTIVADQSTGAALTLTESLLYFSTYSLTTATATGFQMVKLADPQNGEWLIKEIIRSDGKIIKPENGWLSKTRNGSDWDYYINLFDSNSTGSYSVVYMHPTQAPQPPEFDTVPFQWGMEEHAKSFIVTATDPNGTVPRITATRLPMGSSFADQGNGNGLTQWTPAAGQAGQYEFLYTATDGKLSASKKVPLIIYPGGDDDNDGIADYWENTHFGNLDRDGSGDWDGDGISDKDEFENGTNPINRAPSTPEIVLPIAGAEVDVHSPTLMITESTDPDNDPITYTYEIYNAADVTLLLASSRGNAGNAWTPSISLFDNSRYIWRVRAADESMKSGWSYGEFFINTVNDPPSLFHISRPRHDGEVDVTTPLLEVTNSTDIDLDAVSYTFEIYDDVSGTNLVTSSLPVDAGSNGKTSWVVDTPLMDTTRYYWKAVATDEHGVFTATSIASFVVNTANDAPTAPIIVSPAIGSEVTELNASLVVENTFDLDNDVLTYVFELDTVNTFDSVAYQVAVDLAQGVDVTSADFTGLVDNTLYFWRVRADDGAAPSPWTEGSFFVNIANEDPAAVAVMNPGDTSRVTSRIPTLELFDAKDADRDDLTYSFAVYGDLGLTQLLAQGVSDSPTWTVPTTLDDNTWNYWTAGVDDEHGGMSGSTGPMRFFVLDDQIDDPPTITMLEPADSITTMADTLRISWEDDDPDSNAVITLTYDSDVETGVEVVAGIEEDLDGTDDSYLWDISTLADGVYTITAVIIDGASQASSIATGTVTIARSVNDTVPQGTEVTMDLVEEVSLTFSEVDTTGEMTVEKMTDPAAPANFMLVGGDAFQVTFTGSFVEEATICINYDETKVVGLESDLLLAHWDGVEWLDITNSLDTITNTICGRTDSFSPFLVLESDRDNDGIPDSTDECTDVDGDLVCDEADVCVYIPNPDQADFDNDGAGDLCDDCPTDGFKIEPGICGCGIDDVDTDGDGVADCIDNCPATSNPDQVDSDGDGFGDLCESCPNDYYKTTPGTCGCGVDDVDTDNDGVADCIDNCPDTYNPDQADTDGDGNADACDACPFDNPDDSDGDGVCDSNDICAGGNDGIDTDGDGVPDACDACPVDNPDDSDGDGVCNSDDICAGGNDSIDNDGDGTPDDCDICPLDNPDDSDGDGICNSNDICAGGNDSIDYDNDGTPDFCDACPQDNPDDSDSDGVCNSSDICPGGNDGIDGDNDGTPDFCDACPLDNPDDSDGDGVCNSSDICDGGDDALDADNDGTPDACDACPQDNPDDTDGDGVCESDDVCAGGDDTVDFDNDGVPDDCDICPLDELNDSDEDGVCDSDDICLGGDDNIDGDLDGLPDFCDVCPLDADNDIDGDAICGDIDNCPVVLNSEQTDSDMDGSGDVCDVCPFDADNDVDGDGICGDVDNCPVIINIDQADADNDGQGDLCDVCPMDADNDIDGDGFCGDVDNCPADANAEQVDEDNDGLGDICDVCPVDPDNDIDGDGICAEVDNCPVVLNPEQVDADNDGQGDFCDTCPLDPENDVDVDGICGDVDNCPADANIDQTDMDNDGLGDVCDTCPNDVDNDMDGDSVCGDVDNCPLDANPGQEDLDQDGLGDACDPQTCGNGIKEEIEKCDDGNFTDGDGCSAQCISESIISVKKAEVEWDDGEIKYKGTIRLPLGVTHYSVVPQSSVDIDISLMGQVVFDQNTFTVKGDEGKKWEYKHGTTGIDKFKIDWKGAKFEYNDILKIKANHIGLDVTSLEIEREGLTGDFSIQINGVTIQVDAENNVVTLPETLPIDADDDDDEIEVDLPFAMTADMIMVISRPGFADTEILVVDYFTYSIGKFDLRASFDSTGYTGLDFPPNLSLRIDLGVVGYPGYSHITGGWKTVKVKEWKYKE